MAKTTFIPNGHMAKESVSLGRFVKNLKSPTDSYHEPSRATELVPIVTEVENFRGTYESDRDKHFLVKLTQFVAFGLSRRKKVVSHISTKCAKQYVLDNSEEYYRSIIGHEETKKWIERAVKEGDKICLLVGIVTFQDAVVFESETEFNSSEFRMMAPVTDVLVGATVAFVPGLIPSDLLDAGAENFGCRGAAIGTGYEIKGEQVFALQYRQVKISLLNSRDLGKSLPSALRESQWKVLTRHRFAHTVDTNDIIDSEVGEFEFDEDDDEVEEWQKFTDEDGDIYIESAESSES